MSEDKERNITQPDDALAEKAPDVVTTLPESIPITPKSILNVNEQKEITVNDPDIKNDNVEEPKESQQSDLNDTSNGDSESNIKNKELKSLMQLTKEANLNMSIPEKLESKRLMRSHIAEIGVNKPKGKPGQGPNILEKDDDASFIEGGGGKKRKRDSSSDSMIGGAVDGQNKELLKATMELVEKNKDGFCWKCHRDGITISCTTCPRSYHSKCLKNISTTTHWICPECTSILTAENTKTRSPALKDMPLGHLCKLLKFALKRMVQINDSEPFVSPVNESEFPDYRNYIVQPMDFTMLEKNIKSNSYGSTKAFEADSKWLLHNSIVFNSSQSKLTTVAKSIIKICKQEMIEIENCPTCYLNANTKKSWFVEVCPKPHLLVWAKLKGFPYWPAKVMCTNNQGSVDVRFFGAHDRAWVSVKDCYLYSVKDPNATHHKKDEINECVKEVETYINNLKNVYGKFNYPPYRTPYQPEKNMEQLEMFLPSYKNETKAEENSQHKLQSDEEDWEVRKYIEEGRNIKSPSPEDMTPKRVPKKPLKTYSSEDIISNKRSRRNSLQSNSSRISNISDKTITKMEIESEDEKKEIGKIKISDKLIKKFAPEIDINKKEENFAPKETILGTIDNDLMEIKEKEKISTTRKEEKINPIQIKIKAITNMRKPKKKYQNVLKVAKPKYKIEMVNLKQDTFGDDDDEDEEDSLLEEMYSIEENQIGKVSKSKVINGTPKRKRNQNVLEFSSPIESKLLKLVDVDLIKNPKLHPLDIPGHTITPIIKERNKDDVEKNKDKDEEIQIKTEIESEDDDYNESTENFLNLNNEKDTKIQKCNEDIVKRGSENLNKKGNENFPKRMTENLIKKGAENIVKKGVENATKKLTENITKKVIEQNDIEKIITKGSEKVLKPTSLLKLPMKIPQTSLLKTKQPQKSTETTPTSLNSASKITTTPGIDSGGMMILTQPKPFLNNQLVLPPNQNITYGANSISFVQHPQFQNYLIPTSAINVSSISLPVSNSSITTTTLITNLTTTSTSTSLIASTTPTFIISKPISSLNPSKSNVNNKSSPVTISTKPLPPLCRPQVSLSSQITLTAISNPTTTSNINNNNSNPVSGSIPPPLCSLTTTTASNMSTQVISSAATNSSLINTTNNGAVSQKDDGVDDFNYLSGYIPEKLMKALTETTSRPPPPLLTAKPTTNNTSICERITNSTGPIAMKINSATHKLTDYFRETMIKFLSEFSTTSDSSSTVEAEIALLKLELENLKQQHSMEILEMKQNLQTILKEVHRNFTEERQRAVDETRRECELDAQKRIEDAKSKQWCSVCGKEAQFYCCWNTSYCDYPCQIKHWPTHIDRCTQSCVKTDAATTGNGKQSVAGNVAGKKSGGLSKLTVSTESNFTSANKPKVYSNPKTSVQNKTSNSSKVVTQL
nr:protein kinase C-binding protein 1 isoform X2 [Onthophagus taurus]